jgi:hypothetical protein
MAGCEGPIFWPPRQKKMRVGVIGAGAMGGPISTSWLASGQATARLSSQNIGQHVDPLQIVCAHPHAAHVWESAFLMGGDLAILKSAARTEQNTCYRTLNTRKHLSWASYVHSLRSASIGSTPAARRAGKYAAASPPASSIRVTAPIVHGSCTVTPYSSVCSNCALI